MAAAPRDVTPIISWLRNILNGRKLHSVHRFEMLTSPRSAPPPALPHGPSHLLSANSYQARDGRRLCEAPRLAYDPKALPSGTATPQTGEQQAVKPTGLKTPLPGFGYDWQTGADLYKKP